MLFARTAGPYSSVVSSRQVCWFDPSLLDGSWRIEPAIWGTVEVEVALPILLAARRTRIVGLVVGGGFHTVLALAGNVPFTALAFAFYVAFLPLDTPSACAPSASADPNDPARPAVHTVWDLGPPRWVARWPWPCSPAPGWWGCPERHRPGVGRWPGRRRHQLVRFELDRYLRSHPAVVATYTTAPSRRHAPTDRSHPVRPSWSGSPCSATCPRLEEPGADSNPGQGPSNRHER